MKVYAKNSFDRLGDDLTELILQYLTFEDKVRLECVSKQWRRLVFNKQFVIEKPYSNESSENWSQKLYRKINIYEPLLDRQALESVLKKCHFIKKIDLKYEINTEVLSLIGRYCPNIKSLSIFSSDVKLMDFGRQYGHKLEEFFLYVNNEEMKQFLEFCSNLKIIKVNNESDLYNTKKEFLPKLEYIRGRYQLLNDCKLIEIISVKYSQTIKKLNATMIPKSEEIFGNNFESICSLENLRELRLNFFSDEFNNFQSLSLIGQKCTKLLKMKLNFCNLPELSEKFFDIFLEFKALKKLILSLPFNIILNGNIESFKHCKQLNELYINYPELREEFFVNIGSFVPNLKILSIRTQKQYSDSFINSVHSMKNIQKITLTFDNPDNRKFNYKFWFSNNGLPEKWVKLWQKKMININDKCVLIAYASDYMYRPFHI